MKTLIILVVGLLSVGCKTIPVQLYMFNEQKQKALRDSVVGTYEVKIGDISYRTVLLENGIGQICMNNEKGGEGKWKITKEGEIHATKSKTNPPTTVFRSNKDKSITLIAHIDKDGKRTGYPKEGRPTYKKIE